MNASQHAKQRGARCYAAKDYANAVTYFTEAIERADGSDMDLHLYHSNRCAAYQQLGRWREALDDAEARSGRLESLAELSDRRSGGILGPSAFAWPFCCCAWPFCAARAALGGIGTRRALRLGLFDLVVDFAARLA